MRLLLLKIKKKTHNIILVRGHSTTKGQVVSKRFLGSSISSKKRTNEFVFTTVRIVFVRFLEEIDDPKKPFRN